MHLVCSRCAQVNRVPEARLVQEPKCGRCHEPILSAEPVNLTAETFTPFITRNDLPVVVDFWADWCAPCKMFAPVFAQAAKQYRQQLRLAKLDTEAHPQVVQPLSIRGIPTMISFSRGTEIDRVSGALDYTRLRGWLERQLSQAGSH
jgi:thioredoxin 2